jgi:hypothetical protein
VHAYEYISYRKSVKYTPEFKLFSIRVHIKGCTNPGCQVARATKFCTVAPDTCICGSSVWNVLHVTHLAPRTLRCFLDLKILWTCVCVCVCVYSSSSLKFEI